MWSAAATAARMARARRSSTLSSAPSSQSLDQMRVRLWVTSRLSNGRAASKVSYAATLAKLSVRVPMRGRTPRSSGSHTAAVPQNSLPWVSALTITCGPGRADSNRCTYSMPVLPAR